MKIKHRALQTLLLSSVLPSWCFSMLEKSKHELQAFVTLTHRQVDICADSAKRLEQRRQKRLEALADSCSSSGAFHVHTQENGPGQFISLFGVR